MNRMRAFVSVAIGAAFLALTGLERLRPLRPERESKLRRLPRNLLVAACSAAAVTLLERPIVEPLAVLVERRRWGLLYSRPLPRALRMALGVLLLDYTLYVWHVLVHRVPWLWRFHLVHHADLDLDASTALRFHFGELTLSIPWRAAQIVAIGVGPGTLSLWQTALFVSILFHHSNIELPLELERTLNRFLVTPRMHGIHHSMVPEDTDSNWSSGLTLWDWLHGTLRLNIPQREVTIGVPAYRDPRDVTLVRSLELPFGPQRPWRLLPGDGEPVRHVTNSTSQRLLA